jgi:hypothetical protein
MDVTEIDRKLKDASILAADSLLHTTSFVSIYYNINEEKRKEEMEFLFNIYEV